MKEATGIRILKTIDKIMKNWFILHGTLLGLIRDGKFISWDHDLDFAIEYKDWNDKILLDLKKEFIIAKKSCFRRNALKYVGDNKIGKLTKLRLADKETNLHFCLEIYHEGIGEYKNYMYFQTPIRPRNYIIQLPKELISPQISTIFYKTIVMIPEKHIEFLEFMYGDNWKTPMQNYPVSEYYIENSKKYRILL